MSEHSAFFRGFRGRIRGFEGGRTSGHPDTLADTQTICSKCSEKLTSQDVPEETIKVGWKLYLKSLKVRRKSVRWNELAYSEMAHQGTYKVIFWGIKRIKQYNFRWWFSNYNYKTYRYSIIKWDNQWYLLRRCKWAVEVDGAFGS